MTGPLPVDPTLVEAALGPVPAVPLDRGDMPYLAADIDMVARWLRQRAQGTAERRLGRSVAPSRLLSWPVARDLAVGVLRMLDKADDAAWNAWRAGLDYVRSRTVEDA